MKKLVLFLSLAILTVSNAFAGLSKDELIKAIKGKYILSTTGEFSGEEVMASFLIRSSGKLEFLDADNGKERITDGTISYNFSDSDYAYTGMPVAHLTFLYGSDEDSFDHHLLLTANKDGKNLEIVKIAAFKTFNDGPNDIAEYFGTSKLVIKKYNKKTKRYTTIR